MNESPEYILINTPELKSLYSPQQKTDEYWSADHNGWRRIAFAMGFGRLDTYRRARSLAWLPIAAHPVQYPAWLHNPVIYTAAVYRTHEPAVLDKYTVWQPAPAAPQPPPAPVDPSYAACDAWFTQTKTALMAHESIRNYAHLVWQAGVNWAALDSSVVERLKDVRDRINEYLVRPNDFDCTQMHYLLFDARNALRAFFHEA